MMKYLSEELESAFCAEKIIPWARRDALSVEPRHFHKYPFPVALTHIPFTNVGQLH